MSSHNLLTKLPKLTKPGVLSVLAVIRVLSVKKYRGKVSFKDLPYRHTRVAYPYEEMAKGDCPIARITAKTDKTWRAAA